MARAAKVIAATGLAASALATAAPAEARVWTLGVDAPSLEAALAAAADGDEIRIPPGQWRGGVRVTRSVTLRGEEGAVVDGQGEGTVLEILAPLVVIEGLEVRGSGNGMENPRTNVDACLWSSPAADGLEVRNSRFPDCLFGIYVQQSDRAQIVGNEVHGRPTLREVDRGNGIHLFDASHVVVEGNVIDGTRDGLYISATDDSRIIGNRIHHVRYAVHYMWSHRNHLEDNEATDSLAGFALMQSHDLVVVGNRMARNRRAGLLARDGQRSVYRHNDIVANGTGIFVYNSIREHFEENLVAHNDIGMRIWGALAVDDVFARNSLIGNAQQIFYFGNRDMRWGEPTEGNHFSDYLGWDQDHDGVGERPYRVDSLTSNLIYRFPAAALLLRSPALELLAHLQDGLPMFRVATVTDTAPITEPTRAVEDARRLQPEGGWHAMSETFSAEADEGHDLSM
ncbi:MAG: nitrous oxide reductase family maturation protein NosD [Sandaracinaceae bacterium]|nr:nitrous oxide reductase family maturation protein NosD [Sandaracinaceae bacterium]